MWLVGVGTDGGGGGGGGFALNSIHTRMVTISGHAKTRGRAQLLIPNFYMTLILFYMFCRVRVFLRIAVSGKTQSCVSVGNMDIISPT